MKLTKVGPDGKFKLDSYVRVSKHLRGIPQFHAEGMTESGCTFRAVIAWSSSARTYEVKTLTVERGDEDTPVNTVALRDISARSIIQQSFKFYDEPFAHFGILNEVDGPAGLLVADDSGCGSSVWLWRKEVRDHRDNGYKFRPDKETLEVAASIYELAQAMGEMPTKAIQDDFGLPLSTAQHWVKLARERGHLE